LSKKKTKKSFLTQEEKKKNQELAGERVVNENVIGMLKRFVIGMLKRFKIISDKYRNRRKRFGLRFNLIAGIYNLELIEISFERGLLQVQPQAAPANINEEVIILDEEKK
jgi:hypothetical protein